MVVFVQKLSYLDKVVVIGKNGCIRQKGLYFVQNSCFPAKWL